MEVHKRLIHDLCDLGGCRKLASYRVYNHRGSIVGQYCEEHADERVEMLKEHERAIDRATR